MQLEADVVALLAVVATAMAGVLLLVVVVMGLRLRALRRTYRAAVGDGGTEVDLFGAVRAQSAALESLREDVKVVHGNTERLRDLHREAVSRVGLVRYDAFPDMGGMLSFSAALLDEHGTGVVISAINGRQETRAYGKPVLQGESEHSLSDEEREAVAAAVEGRGPGSMVQPGGRRRGRRG